MRPNIGVLRSALAPMLTESGELWAPGEGEPVLNEETGMYEEPPPVMVWSGRCLVRAESRDVQMVTNSIGLSWAAYRYEITLPAGIPASRGMWLYLTACPWEPDLIGHQIRLIDVPLDAWAVARTCVGESTTA